MMRVPRDTEVWSMRWSAHCADAPVIWTSTPKTYLSNIGVPVEVFAGDEPGLCAPGDMLDKNISGLPFLYRKRADSTMSRQVTIR